MSLKFEVDGAIKDPARVRWVTDEAVRAISDGGVSPLSISGASIPAVIKWCEDNGLAWVLFGTKRTGYYVMTEDRFKREFLRIPASGDPNAPAPTKTRKPK